MTSAWIWRARTTDITGIWTGTKIWPGQLTEHGLVCWCCCFAKINARTGHFLTKTGLSLFKTKRCGPLHLCHHIYHSFGYPELVITNRYEVWYSHWSPLMVSFLQLVNRGTAPWFGRRPFLQGRYNVDTPMTWLDMVGDFWVQYVINPACNSMITEH